ncbi:MAG TPA: hypothetical protein ENH82_19795 [bacterium]|nr:hypothetical protein [bacterium]
MQFKLFLSIIFFAAIVTPGKSEELRQSTVTIPYANVKAFGAVGDGKTDDSAAIQKALVSDCGTVFFPKGTYRVTQQLTVPRNIHIVAYKKKKILMKIGDAT